MTGRVRAIAAAAVLATAAIGIVAGQQTQPEPAVTISGTLGMRFFDSFTPDGPSFAQYFVQSADGTETPVRFDQGVVTAEPIPRLLGAQVTITGAQAEGRAVAAQTVFRDVALPAGDVTAVSGSYAFANLFCQFSDSAGTQPHPPSFYSPLLTNSHPQLDHYWRASSFTATNLAGSATTSAWVTLPQPRSYYIKSETDPTGNLYGPLAQHCLTAADPLFNAPSFTGLNMFFNVSLGCCSVGGPNTLTADGQTRSYHTTWINPVHSNTASTLAHEIGHNFGFPHSSGPYGQTYDSKWDVMSFPGGRCSQSNDFGCSPQHTVAFHHDFAGWIAASRKFVAPGGVQSSITLSETGGASASGYLLAQVPLSGTTRFMTIEVRRQSDGYDVNVPGNAVVIHLVNTTTMNTGDLNTPVAIVVDGDSAGDPNDAGAQWTAGETYTNSTYGVSVTVVSTDTLSANVTIDTRVQVGSLPVVATHPSGSSILMGQTASVSVAANGQPPLSYQWYRRSQTGTASIISGATSSSYTTGALTVAERLFARVTNANGSADSNTATIAVGVTDPTVTAGVTVIRAIHLQQLRDKVAALRSQVGLGTVAWTDPSLGSGTMLIRAVHITELRAALLAVYSQRGVSAPTFSDPSLGGRQVGRVHLVELRNAIAAIE